MLKDEKDFQSFFEDTLKAGHYENDKTSVEIMIRSSQAVVEDLLRFGADFQKDEKGELVFTREGSSFRKTDYFSRGCTGREDYQYPVSSGEGAAQHYPSGHTARYI